jgi:hypothetical protein
VVCASPLPQGIAIIMTSPTLRRLTIRNCALTLLASMPLVLSSLLAAPFAAQAQNAPAAPSDRPPQLEKLEEGPQPNLTTPKPPAGKGTTDQRPGTTDHRDNSGAVTETEVRTPVSTYVVKPNKQVGNAQPGDAQSVGNRAAQFKIGEFGPGRKKPVPPEETPQTPEPAPPAKR